MQFCFSKQGWVLQWSEGISVSEPPGKCVLGDISIFISFPISTSTSVSTSLSLSTSLPIPMSISLSTSIPVSIYLSTLYLPSYLSSIFYGEMKGSVWQCLQRWKEGSRKRHSLCIGSIHRLLGSHIQDKVAISRPCTLPCSVTCLGIYAKCRKVHVWLRLYFLFLSKEIFGAKLTLWLCSWLFRCLHSCYLFKHN